jgi:L-fuculose-phosphate aldolase
MGTVARPGAAERAARAELVEVGRRLHARDLVGAAEGNLSVRLGPDRFLVTASGVSKGHLRPSDLVVVDGHGATVTGTRRASTELRMHLAVYAARPEVAAVVHAHPITAVALTVAGAPPPADLVPEAAVTLGPIAVAPFATPGTDEVPRSLAPLWRAHQVILLERHGALTLGRDLFQAFDRMETLERVCEVAAAARALGRWEPLSPDAVEKVVEAGRALAARASRQKG